jgi:hypothetical protein
LGRAIRQVMRKTVDTVGAGKPTSSHRTSSSACSWSGPAPAEKALRPAAMIVPRQEAEHMAAPTQSRRPAQKALANGEPSTHGMSRKATHAASAGPRRGRIH